MNEIDHTSHAIQDPHLDLRSDGHADFAPLKLTVQPGNARAVVTRPEAIVGRHSRADIRLAFPEVSRRHARVVFHNGQWRIVDLNSLNGVWINGERMHDAVLYDGDRVRIGVCVLTVERGTPFRRAVARKTDPQLEVYNRIVEAMPRQAS